MPNLLSAAFGAGNSIRTSGTGGLFNPSGARGAATAGFATAFSTGSLGAGAGAALAPLGLGGLGLAGVLGGGAGTKPKALHTEYAQEDAQWAKPYGSGTDIVFYLVRADQTSSISDTGNNFGGDLSKNQGPDFNGQANTLTTRTALATNIGGQESSRIPSNVTAGPNTLQPKSPSPMAQVGGAAKMAELTKGSSSSLASSFSAGLSDGFASANSSKRSGLSVANNVTSASSSLSAEKSSAGAVPTAVGPLTNFDKTKSVLPSLENTAVAASTVASNVDSIANAVGAGTGNRFSKSFSSGAKYWSEQLNASFNDGNNSPFKVPVSELSTNLSLATGGINSSELLANSALSGETLFSSPEVMAGANQAGFGAGNGSR